MSTGYRCEQRYGPRFAEVIASLFRAGDTLESRTGTVFQARQGVRVGLMVCWPDHERQHRTACSLRSIDAHSLRAGLTRRADDARRWLRGARSLADVGIDDGAPGGLHIQTLAVAADQQRRGIGSALLEQAIDRARRQGLSHVGLHTRVANRAACALYARHGFAAIDDSNGCLSLQRTL